MCLACVQILLFDHFWKVWTILQILCPVDIFPQMHQFFFTGGWKYIKYLRYLRIFWFLTYLVKFCPIWSKTSNGRKKWSVRVTKCIRAFLVQIVTNKFVTYILRGDGKREKKSAVCAKYQTSYNSRKCSLGDVSNPNPTPNPTLTHP